ncbi:MAG: Crp/Fnr family transcriptional regulator [Candidatus Cohnella colombiensis]|uniref:Crp/Fnr family transcriptional regulator n=1 Tax=Candidatus Cohnella colombiensis TaxID=3121368 RepID=A0AA95F1Z2_9BACL|nr:MAG: Crp/Fnr family transcriptional regulator [Cohnella sp.]
MKNNTTATLLKQLMLFQDLNDEELARIEDIIIAHQHAKKSTIFNEGSEKEAVFFIQSGLVKAYKTDENGNEQIVSYLKSGDMFPHTGLFNQSPYPATAEAIVNSVIWAIPIRRFELLLMDTPSIAIKILRVMGDKIRELQEKLQVLSGQDVKNRIISFLILLAEQHGQQKDNTITINLPMTHQEFANSVGTTRETVNRLLNQLSKDNLLSVDRNRFIIKDMDGLMGLRDPK